MKCAEVNAIIDAVAAWAVKRADIRAVALVGSRARGDPGQSSDIDLLLLSDKRDDYRRRRWLAEIDFERAGYQVRSSNGVTYGAVWSRHVHLLPAAEVELTFAKCSWARTCPIDDGTRDVVKDAFRIIIDKDGRLAELVRAVTAG
jgi:predicted nucleotidyltransferase